MEIELKYTLSAELAEAILTNKQVAPYLNGEPETIRLHAVYYDTPDGWLAAKKTALRLRYEGAADASDGGYICCLKRKASGNGGFSRREEYECPAETIRDGIHGLLKQGAPSEILVPLLTENLVNVAEVRCLRKAALLTIEDTQIELALDCGTFPTGSSREIPFRELELELKSGREEVLLAFGMTLAKAFDLEPIRQSKYARALAARREG